MDTADCCERIVRWEVFVRRLAYHREVRWSDMVESAAQFVVLRIETESGGVGAAEVAVKPTWVGATASSLVATLREVFEPIVKKVGLSHPRQLRDALEVIPGNTVAKALIDNACWDWEAARQRQPLWRLWGGRPVVELSWAVTRQAPQAMAREAAEMVDAYGFRNLKVKGGQGLNVDRAAVAAVRQAVGEGVRLYVDANGSYPFGEAEPYVRAMAEEGAHAVEDPAPLSPDGAFERLQCASGVPVLVDFGMTSVRDAALFLERGARILSAKPGRFGLSDARAMRNLADRAGAGTVAGLMGESALGTWCGLQFAALEGQALPAELSWFLSMREQYVTLVPRIEKGRVVLPETPTVAELVDWDAMREFEEQA
ncbi:enolase C-terminal domain-like protein [uncultured Pigmentiphaga sp.]|uniref:mandelate racemase/muconate lactonizing enzyme family protein n=1 Tax=uncultured Pigmentiphaga sp. TaxID=340361 RepID=UPI002618B070|nr:enolase C-terminal domain-like protein [uncultured Pigmentiphaga sp.]